MIGKNATEPGGGVPRAAGQGTSPRRGLPATWVDPEHGLEWQCAAPGPMSWQAARDYAGGLELSGRADWRLPTVAELETLLDRTRYRPVVRAEVPFADERSYWSSTTFGQGRRSAWIVMFDGAYVLSYFKTNAYHVRCVRGRDRLHEEDQRWPSCL